MTAENIITLILSILTIAGAVVSYYLFIKNKILSLATDAINIAEDTDKVEAEKMEVAIEEIMKILPANAKIFFTRERVRIILQAAFDGIELFATKQAAKDK